jgi:16S rRNA (guanine966-N2)-methyltransferase
MRIIAGKWKGRSLQYPKTRAFRPTQDRAKESLFNILAPHLQGAIVWDLCTGTGGLGIEALSRGASHVTFVDTDLTFLHKNLTPLFTAHPPLLPTQYKALKLPLARFLSTVRLTESPTVILCDPPWDNHALYTTLLTSLILTQLAPTARIICEHNTKNPPPFPDILKIQNQYTYGATTFTILTFLKDKVSEH